ncbi:MAG: glycosyltransferase family 9 protein, partial [Candidatus Omnitrophota bacterium]
IKIKVDDNLFREFIGQRIVAIHAFTSDPVKQWPVERFIELAQRIMEGQGQPPVGTVPSKIKVVFVGRVENQGQSLSGIAPSGVIDLINKTSLVELAALLKRCSLLVSCDSGPVHLAASVGTPVIALFRNDLPGKTAQRWGPWGEGHVVIEKANLADISVDEALEAVRGKCDKEKKE